MRTSQHFRRYALLASTTLLTSCATVSSQYIGDGDLIENGRLQAIAPAPLPAPASPAPIPATGLAPAPMAPAPSMLGPRGLPFCDTVSAGETCEERQTPRPVAPITVKPAETSNPKPITPAVREAAPDNTRSSGGTRDNLGGLTYFLPRQLARVTASRTESKLDDAVKTVTKAQSEAEAATAKVDAATGAIRQTEDAIVGLDASAPGQAILSARLAAQKADLAAANATVVTKKAALDTAKKDLQTAATAARTAGPGAYKVTLKIELLPPTADPRQAFVLRAHHSALRDDEQKLVVSPAGLLTSTDVTATDRTADILVEIATFAGAIASGGATLIGKDDRELPPHRDCTQSPDDFTAIVDFAEPASVQTLNNDLQCLGVRTSVSGRRWSDNSRPAPDSYYKDIQGIVYRTPVEVEVRIEKCTDKAGACAPDSLTWFPTEVIALALPQAGPMTYVRQDAGFLTRSKYTLAFKDGILTNYDSSRPSEILEVARTPMRLLNAAFDGVSKVISLRTGQNNALAGLSTSQLALLNAQNALAKGDIDGQRTLSEAQLALARAQYALQAAPAEGLKTLSAADLALFQQQLQLQSAAITGQTGLTNDQLALLQAKAGLAIGTNTIAAQLSANQLALIIAQLKDRARQEALSRCVSEHVAAGTPIDACVSGN